jgi:peptide/nickel transport system permease protein
VLSGATNIILFFVTLYAALSLSRNYGSWIDRFVVGTSPMSAAPAWFYGIFVIVIFAAYFQVLPFGGMVDAPPPDNKLEYALSMLKHLILPTLALSLNQVTFAIYSNRTFFLIYSSEDYVEMAKAKGLTAREIDQYHKFCIPLNQRLGWSTNFRRCIQLAWFGAHHPDCRWFI